MLHSLEAVINAEGPSASQALESLNISIPVVTGPELLQAWRTAIETAGSVELFDDCLSLLSFYLDSLANLKAELNRENVLAFQDPTFEEIRA